MKTVNYDLYGFETNDLDSLVEPLEQVLGIKFEAHSSDNWGDYYSYGRSVSENFDLKPNLDGEGEWLEENHKEKTILFYVNETQRAEKIERKLIAALPRVELLWRKTYPKEIEVQNA